MFKPGETFERYLVEEAIGEGGMGRVYRAYDERLARKVAIKVLTESSEPDANARLIREARAAAALNHANAVSIFDAGESGGVAFIVMEFVPGKTLRIAAASASVATRVEWLGAVARALSAAHSRGLVHR